VALPDSCELTASHLVFWELATRAQSEDVERLYEHCCMIACTNFLRPLGDLEVTVEAIPGVADGGKVVWGSRTLEAEAARAYAAEGYVLCELRLPVQAMSAPVPPGVASARPPGT
jgi:hypothetical protein